MSFYKQSQSNITNNEIVEVIDVKTCEKCHSELNMMKTKNGFVNCGNCGHANTILEHNNV